MSDVYRVPGEWAESSHIDKAKYQAMYERSIKDPDGFWREQAQRLDWYKEPTRIKDGSLRRRRPDPLVRATAS